MNGPTNGSTNGPTSTAGTTVLIIEDDRAMREGLVLNFKLEGYHVVAAADGDHGMALAFDSKPDLIVLDLMLPGYNGMDILEELRERGEDVPVMILSARSRMETKLEGLDLGADDYITKPFELPELLARARVLLRRRHDRSGQQSKILTVGPLTIDPALRRITNSGVVLDLSQREFDLLLLLARHPGRPFTRDDILEKVWGWDYAGTTRTVDNVILSLRQKLEPDQAQPQLIRTMRGVGYKLEL